jgi:hypothetical protein
MVLADHTEKPLQWTKCIAYLLYELLSLNMGAQHCSEFYVSILNAKYEVQVGPDNNSRISNRKVDFYIHRATFLFSKKPIPIAQYRTR